MNHWPLLLILLLLPVCVRAGDIYHIRPMSEPELMATYETMIRDACRQADGNWHDASFDPNAGHWGNGLSGENEGIRAISHMMVASGTLLKYSHALTPDERANLKTKMIKAARYVVATHITGTQKCTDGKQWGASWQSPMWAAAFAFGAWFVWDDLDQGLRKDIERVMASECDRVLTLKIPTGRWNDTKAEENGWTLICLSVAANMFPSNPHASAWNEKALEYMMNTLSAPKDMKDETVIDGRPMNKWVLGPNLHPDYTLENHGIFHLSYVQCSSYFLTESAMHYVYAGRPVPKAARHHLMDTWHMFETFVLPWGETAYPHGIDWEQHNLPATNLFASLGTYMHDPNAAAMEQINLQYLRQWQEWCDGSLTVPGSPAGFARHAIQAEQIAYCYLAHKLFGPPAKVEATKDAASLVRSFSSVGVLVHRTPSKFFSFSWKYRLMGVLVPVGGLGDPFFTVPIRNGLVGSIELAPAGDAAWKVSRHTWKRTSNGFDTSGEITANGGRLNQAIRVTSIGARTVVYQDRVTALSDVAVARELGAPIAIENDKLSGGTRTLTHDGGSLTLDWQKPQPAVRMSGNWANVDGHLGVVSCAGSGLAYIQATGYTPQAVYADMLYSSFSDKQREFKAGDEVAHRVVIFFTEITPEETAALAKSAKIEGQTLRFKLPEGGEGEVSLL